MAFKQQPTIFAFYPPFTPVYSELIDGMVTDRYIESQCFNFKKLSGITFGIIELINIEVCEKLPSINVRRIVENLTFNSTELSEFTVKIIKAIFNGEIVGETAEYFISDMFYNLCTETKPEFIEAYFPEWEIRNEI